MINVGKYTIWLVVSTHLKKYDRQNGFIFPKVRVKITNIWNHHLASPMDGMDLRKLQHTSGAHPRQSPYPIMKGCPLQPVGKGLGVCSKGVLKQP